MIAGFAFGNPASSTAANSTGTATTAAAAPFGGLAFPSATQKGLSVLHNSFSFYVLLYLLVVRASKHC